MIATSTGGDHDGPEIVSPIAASTAC